MNLCFQLFLCPPLVCVFFLKYFLLIGLFPIKVVNTEGILCGALCGASIFKTLHMFCFFLVSSIEAGHELQCD